MDDRINKNKTQERLVTTQADRKVTGKPAGATSTFATVQQRDTNRREMVKKLIQQFENHPNKEFFLQDLNKTEEINTFSEESKKLITDMGNTEIFELLRNLFQETLLPIVIKIGKLALKIVHVEEV